MENAAIVKQFRILEQEGVVRICMEEEFENYFDVWGEPDTEEEREEIERQLEIYGCWIVATDVYNEWCGRWEMADSIGMCTGYRNPLDPDENEYVPSLMASAIEAVKQQQLSFITC